MSAILKVYFQKKLDSFTFMRLLSGLCRTTCLVSCYI